MPNLRHWAGNSIAYAVVFGCLIDGPHTVFELADESGLAENTLRKLIFQLRQRKRIRVGGWDVDDLGRFTIPAWVVGTGPDVPRPRSRTATERSAARRERLRLDPLQNLGRTMKLYKTTAGHPDNEYINYTEFASSASDASKARTRLKKAGLMDVKTEEIETNTDRQSLIRLLNSLTAHESWTTEAVTEKLGG